MYQEKKTNQEKKIMKLTLKLFLVICLFSSVTFADGDMTTGGKNCTQNCGYTNNEQPEPTAEVPTSTVSNQSASDNSVLTSVKEYLVSLFEEAGSLVNF